MTDPMKHLMGLATDQLGAFTRSQAARCGLSDQQLRRRVRNGTFIAIGPNAFRVAGSPVSATAALRHAQLDIGDPSWVSGPTAAALHGFDGFTVTKPFHFILPRGRHVSRPGVTIHRSDTIDPIDRCTLDGLPTLSATRTIIDIASFCSSSQLAAALDSGIRDGLLSENLLHRRVIGLRSQGRYGLPLLAEVIAGYEVTRGGHSWLEREFLTLLDSAGLPRPDMQQILSRAGDRLVRVDCRFAGTRVVVELLGYRFHRSKRDMTRDAARANALLAAGYLPYQFTYEHVVTARDYVIEVTAGALRRASA